MKIIQGLSIVDYLPLDISHNNEKINIDQIPLSKSFFTRNLRARDTVQKDLRLTSAKDILHSGGRTYSRAGAATPSQFSATDYCV